MTRAYILDSATGRAVLGLIDQSWEKLSYTRRYFGMDTFEMTINRSRLWADQIQTGRLLYLPDEGDRIFLIEQVQETQEGSLANDEMVVTGRSLEGIAMAERLVIPPAGQDYDKQTAVKSETAIKHYVTDHASASATDVNRRIPGLTVVASAGRGNTITVSGRYQTVFDLVNQIGLMEGIGWEIVYNPTADTFDFDVIVGVDRHASVFFDFAFETLEKWEELNSIVESKTLALVAGQGEGADRDVVVRYQGSMPTGFARREAFIDARDIAKGSTTELNSRGDAFLAASAVETRLEATLHQYGSFRYGTDWDMGDLVLIRNQERGLSYTARVLEVTKEFSTSAAAPIVTAVIDRPFPTLKDQVAAGSGNAGAGKVDYPVAGLVQTGAISPWPTTTAPTGYLICDGSAVSRTTYADLFALIGTTFGVGDGSTTFNLPNLVGRMVIGYNAGDADFNAIGETGGAKTHTHSNHVVTQPSAHSNHVVTQPSAHTLGATGSEAGHTHTSAAHAHGLPFAHTASNVFKVSSAYGVAYTTIAFDVAISTATGGTGSFASMLSENITPAATGAGSSHNHAAGSISNHSGTAVDAHSAHSGAAVDAHSTTDHKPPYMALAWIIKY